MALIAGLRDSIVLPNPGKLCSRSENFKYGQSDTDLRRLPISNLGTGKKNRFRLNSEMRSLRRLVKLAVKKNE